ncbi:MAG: YaiI/YqxD family protein [Campylobacterales bacterium]|nr:YaiI/YqxD family protein [Campylobacterales bacterium]
MLKLYIDGDAFPNLLKPIILRAIEKYKLDTTVVANKKITIGRSNHIKDIIVELGADEADNHIVQMVEEGDLVITADIPLADRVLKKNGYPIDHRGEAYTKDNIKQYLAMRALMEKIRDTGEMTKGPPPFNSKDGEKFSNSLNAFLQANFPSS